MRLIDADAFMQKILRMQKINKDCLLDKEQLEDREINNYDNGQQETFELIIKHLEEQPTAYDVDKVVEQIRKLENCGRCVNRNNSISHCATFCGLGKKLEIVKAGGNE